MCDCLLWAVFTEKTQIVLLLFPEEKIMYVLILAKTRWATFGAIFSQTHLVTLWVHRYKFCTAKIIS
jgi:hypothetical protein